MYKNRFRPGMTSLINFLVILAVVGIVGGGVFALTWVMADSGYAACFVVKCIKIVN